MNTDRRRVRRGAATAAAALALAIGLSGCGTTEVEPTAVAHELHEGLKKKLESVPLNDEKCDGPLEAKVGATVMCTISIAGTPQRYEATVRSVDDGKVKFRFAQKN